MTAWFSDRTYTMAIRIALGKASAEFGSHR
jgi:hypothetical protein